MKTFRITEAFKWAYALRTELGDPYDADISDIISEVSIGSIIRAGHATMF